MEDGKTRRKELMSAWVAGFFDGEGTIGLYSYERLKKGNSPYIIKRLTIENTNKEVMDYYSEFLNENNIKHYRFFHPKRKDRKSSPIYAVSVVSYRGCEKLLKTLLPYLVCKKKQAQAMLEFLELRRTIPWGHPIPEKLTYDYIKKIKQLKQSSEAIRLIPQGGKEMVHTV